MDPTLSDLRLSRIDTLWTVVRDAHRADADVRTAQMQLLDRYGGAARRYLLGTTHNAEAAADLFQDFAVRFLRGDLRGADPNRGRFRDYLKGVLFHLVSDHFKKVKRNPQSLPPDHPEPAVENASEQDQQFLSSWRDELLARSWTGLSETEKSTGRPYFTVLRWRAEHPDSSSQDMAEELSRLLGKPLTAPGVRQTLHRAREQFADLLLDEIAHGLERPTDEALEAELVELGLLEHCRPALDRRAEQSKEESPK